MLLKMKFKRFKITLYIFMAMILPLLCFSKDNTQTLFEKGNANYAKAQYNEALAAYGQIISQGYQSAAVYFNMGNASYKSGDIPSALLYYEKAHKLSPGDDDINFNIRLVNSKTTDKIDELPELFISRWWRAFILSFSVHALAITSICLILLASGIFTFYFFSNSVLLKKTSFYASVMLFVLGVLVIFIAASQVNYFEGRREAIIFSNSVTVKSGPADKAAALFVLHDGTKVNILDSNNGWMKIKLANGNTGWIRLSDAKEI